MGEHLKLVSDGTPFGSKVLSSDGNVLPGICAVNLSIEAGRCVSATLEVEMLEVQAEFSAERTKGVLHGSTRSFLDGLPANIVRDIGMELIGYADNVESH